MPVFQAPRFVPASLTIITLASVAGAQDGPPLPPATTELSPSAVVLAGDEILVTACRRDETSLAVPVAVTAVRVAQRERQNITGLADLSKVLPGLKVGEVFGGVGGTIILRSVGTTAGSNPSLEQTVSTDIDGVRLSCGNALYKSSYNPRPERAPGAQCRNVWVLDGSIHLFRENRM